MRSETHIYNPHQSPRHERRTSQDPTQHNSWPVVRVDRCAPPLFASAATFSATAAAAAYFAAAADLLLFVCFMLTFRRLYVLILRLMDRLVDPG